VTYTPWSVSFNDRESTKHELVWDVELPNGDWLEVSARSGDEARVVALRQVIFEKLEDKS